MASIIQLEAVSEQIAAAPLETIQNVLWHAGDYNLGVIGNPKTQRLLLLLEAADEEWRTKLSLTFQDLVNAWRATREPWSHELLRDRVKAEIA